MLLVSNNWAQKRFTERLVKKAQTVDANREAFD